MDAKEKQLIEFYQNKIINYEFDEKDIYSFLMLLRENMGTHSPVKEFGDFMAHRNKDRGAIHTYLMDNKMKLDHLKNNDVPQDGLSIVSEVVFTTDQIKKSFNQFFKDHGLSLFSTNLVEDIILCIISLLQHIKICEKGGKEIGELHIGYTKESIMLLGFVNIAKSNVKGSFPVLSIRNKYLELPKRDEHDSPNVLPEVIIEVKNHDKRLIIDICEKRL